MVKKCVLGFLVLAGIFLITSGLSEARRAGGGKSFGGKPSYQQSAPKPADINPGQTQKSPGALQQNPRPQTATPGRWSGLGGMLGGLLVGGLIGSLLFGGVGAYGGPGLLDFLIIGAILFFVVKFMKARRSAVPQTNAGQPSREYGFGGFSTLESPSFEVPGKANIPPVPNDFDVDDFLKGAKAAFTRVQDAWARRDLEDLKHFSSAAVLEELKRQAMEDPTPSPVDIILINASLSEVKDEGEERIASVFFDVLMRENPNQNEPSKVQEIWHFKKKRGDASSFWVLDGIQQVE